MRVELQIHDGVETASGWTKIRTLEISSDERFAMVLRRLRYFASVAEELGFRQAVRRLFVSEPALSQQIGDLENELGPAGSLVGRARTLPSWFKIPLVNGSHINKVRIIFNNRRAM